MMLCCVEKGCRGQDWHCQHSPVSTHLYSAGGSVVNVNSTLLTMLVFLFSLGFFWFFIYLQKRFCPLCASFVRRALAVVRQSMFVFILVARVCPGY